MKTCFRAPRMFLPRGGFERWAVPAADSHSTDRAYWERIGRTVGTAPSALGFILPDALVEDENEALFRGIGEHMYTVLEEERIERTARGFMLTERETDNGVRRGIVAALDLEQYSFERGVSAPVRASEAPSPRADVLAKARAHFPLETPHGMLFYRDKKNKLVKSLLEEDLDKMYSFPLMEDGGNITGYFLPEELAYEAADAMMTRGEPSFAVADGHDCIAAAKLYWEALKPTLKERERKEHPARFTLVECINLYDPAVRPEAMHRLVSDVDAEVFCDFFSRRVKCKRKENVLMPALPAGAEGVEKTDALIAEYLHANGGAVRMLYGDNAAGSRDPEEGVVILLKTPEKEDLFAQLKGGALLPRGTFCLGGNHDKRFCLETREITYD